MSVSVVIIASVLLALLLSWLELRSPRRRRLPGRLIATFITVAAFACMIIPVMYTSANKAAATGEIIWLTPGASVKGLSKAQASPIYTNDPSLASPDIVYMPDLSWFLATHPDVKSIRVYGYGLTPQELEILQQQHIHFAFRPAPLPDGFVAASWNRYIRLGNELDVQGTYRNTTNEKVKLVLAGVGTRLDSITIAADSNTTFSLRSTPSHTGNTLYELSAEYPGHKTITEKIPVTISPSTNMTVLLLSSAPAFDNKFLVNWLYENKYQVIARHVVSKNKYALQFLNRTAVSLQNISPALLQTVDVLVTDDEAIATLSPPEKAAIRAQVGKGMGLVLQADSSYAVNPFSKSFPVKKQPGHTINARPLKLAGQATATIPILPVQWLYIESSHKDQPLVTDDNNVVLVSCRLYGAGKVVLNTVSNTFGWLLQGNQPDYARFWSLLLSKAARQQRQERLWQQATNFPVAGDPVELTLHAEGTPSGEAGHSGEARALSETGTPNEIPVIHTPNGKVYVAQHAWLPDTWTGTWWPVEKGWQTISSADSTALYIYGTTDWTTARTSITISSNTAFYQQQEKGATQTGSATVQTTRRVPVIIFWLFFIVGCAYLWIEAKIT